MQGDFFVGDWLVQPQLNTVAKGAKHWRVEPKVMQVLVQLALHPNEVLSKDRLISTVWRDTFVGDDVLVRCISEIRYIFGDDARSPSVVQTIPKSGYRLIAVVNTEVDAANAALAIGPQTQASPEVSPVPEVIPPVLPALHASAIDLVEEAIEQDAPSLVVPEPTLPKETRAEATKFLFRYVPSFLVALLVIGAVTWGVVASWKTLHPSPISFFWAPILEARGPVLLCVADQNEYSVITLRDAADPLHKVVLGDNLSVVVIDDLEAVIRLAAVFKVYAKDYRLKGQEAVALSDLRNGPSVFVGAFDNIWTLRLTNSLRFHFANNPEMTQFRIVDSKNPGRTDWFVDRKQQMDTNVYKDYAIIARFTDSDTGQPALISAGVGRGGTEAAGEFLTNPDNLEQILPAMKAAGNKKNVEIVLSTQIIDGHSGKPKIEDIYFW